jgi:hypothetical protein
MADAGVMTHATRTGILGGRTLFRLGLTLLVLSAVLFLRHSIEQGWIGPEARVALAAAGGLVLVGTGLAVRRVSYGVALQAAGTAVLFLTGFAAHDHYGLTSTTEAFVQLVAVAALTMGLASHARSELLAGLALTAAAGSPALIDGRVALPLAETAYVAAVGGIGILLFHRHGWIRSLVATALAVGVSVALDLTPRLAAEPSLAIPLQASLVIAWAMLVLVPISAARRGIGDRMARVTVPIVTSSFATLGLYAATRLIFDDTGGRPAWAGLALGLGLVHLLAWRLLRGKPESAALGAAQWIPITAMSMVAVVEGLTGDWILAGLSMMALGLVLAGHRGIHARLSDAGHLLFGITAVLAVGTVAIVTGDARRPEELGIRRALVSTGGWHGVRFRPSLTRSTTRSSASRTAAGRRRRLVAVERVLRAEEVAARAHVGDRVDPEGVGVDPHRSEHLGQRLQHLDVDHELLERGDESPLHPAGGVHDDVGSTEHGRPQRRLRLVRRLGVDRVGGVGVRLRYGKS